MSNYLVFFCNSNDRKESPFLDELEEAGIEIDDVDLPDRAVTYQTAEQLKQANESEAND